MPSMTIVERRNIDRKQIAKFSFPIWFFAIFIIIIIVSGDILRGVEVFLYTLNACLILIPYIFPIYNIVLFAEIGNYHTLLTEIMDIKGDQITLFIVFYIAIGYAITGYVILGLTLLFMYLDMKDIDIKVVRVKGRDVHKALIILQKFSLKKIK